MKLEFKTKRAIRAEKFISEALPFLKRTFLQKLFRKHEIKVLKNPLRLDSKIEANAVADVFLPDPRKYFSELTGNQIIFEDKDVIAFAKRAGIATHAGVGTRGDDLRSCAETLLSLKLIVVHRLDRATSGIIIFAKNPSIARKLENAFRERKVFKKYFALVAKNPKSPSGTINLDLKKVGQKMEVVEQGLSAETKWKVIKKHPLSKRGSPQQTGAGGFTLLEVEIKSGRTHQIRAHLAAIGLPVVGDDLYPSTRSARSGQVVSVHSRMFLHAAELKILDYVFEAKLPVEFFNF